VANNKHFSAYTINIIFIILALAGLALIPKLTIKLNPKYTANSLTVSFSWPDVSPGVIEHEVTSKLEGAFSTLRGIEHVISGSSKSYGYITLETKKNTDIETLRFEVLSIIKDLWQRMPEGVSYPQIYGGSEGNSQRQLLISYVLKGNSGTAELQQFAEKAIQPKLAAVKGINAVEVYGGSPYEWHFHYDLEKLKIYDITPGQLYHAIVSANEVWGVGQANTIDTKGDKVIVPVIITKSGIDTNTDEWRKIIVSNFHGTLISLGDLATRTIEQQQPESYFRINGMNTINLNIYSEESVNQLTVADQLAWVESLLKSTFPKGISLEKMYDSTEYLRSEMSKTSRRLLAALLILLVFILIVTRSVRYLLIVSLCLAVNLAIACIFYFIFKVEIHLVSIAGITVSLSIIVDNYIMMTNYLLQKRSMRGFTAILGATLTTLGALVVIFFLNESERGNLTDFAMVVIINLAVSLSVALFLIPALIQRLKVKNRVRKNYIKHKRLTSKLNKGYVWYIIKFRQWRWAMALLAILGFGLPIYLLPDTMKKTTTAAQLYNNTFGSDFYRESIKPFSDKLTGGTLRLFTQNSLNKYTGYRESQETVLYINISLPKGTTILQMNVLCVKLEKYLADFKGISQYQTSINGPQDASITVYFTKQAQQTSIPYQIKSKMIEKAVEYNGGDFGIYIKNDGFSNALYESWRGARIALTGYNYRELINLAQIWRDTLQMNPRIQNFAILSGQGNQYQVTEQQKTLEINKSLLAVTNTSFLNLNNELNNRSLNTSQIGSIKKNGVYIPVRFVSAQSQNDDLWKLLHTPITMGNAPVKLENNSTLSTITTDGSIYKKDQEYMVTLAYDFIGPDELSRRILEREVKRINDKLPLGYKAQIPGYNYFGMDGAKKVNYWLIGLIILIIWGICAIIFESLIQPFAVICSIPLSYIGVFLTFYLFDIAFDQGGFAAFILLSGIVVNMSIYMFNDINHFRRKTNLAPLAIYMKAFNFKIIPILLTSMVTILGLLPFIIFDKGTTFWYAMATGTIGGLLFSIPMLVLYLPLLISTKEKQAT